MRLTLRDDLPFVSIAVTHRGVTVEVADVLVDTGSASTVLSADVAATLGIRPEPTDRLRSVRGVGGSEVVFARRVDRLQLGSRCVDDFEIHVAGMDYGFAIQGILGMSFLIKTGAVLNLRDLTLDYP